MATQQVKLMTPVCDSMYLWITEPNTKFVPSGEWQITCIMEDTQEWKQLIQQLQKNHEEYYNGLCALKGKKLKRCVDVPWKELESGQKILRCKNKVEGEKDGKKFQTKVQIVAGNPPQPITAADLDGRLGPGTKVRVGFSVNNWVTDALGVGVSCRLQLVQIIKPCYYDGLGGFGDMLEAPPEEDNWFKPKGKTVPGTPGTALTAADFLNTMQGMDVENILQ